MNQKIKCPSCGFEFLPDEVLSHQLEEKYRLEYEAKQKEKDAEIVEKERLLTEKAQKIETAKQDLVGVVNRQVEEKLKTEKLEIEKKAKEEASKETLTEIEGLKEVLKQKDNKLDELRKDQIELMKEKQKFEDDKKAFELEMMKREEVIKQKITEELTGKIDENHRLELAARDKRLADTEKEVQELQRKLQVGSQQEQGEILEIKLEDLLREQFPHDEIVPIAKGINGPDITQYIKNKFGQSCGIIVWEAKRVKDWKKDWISKLKQDRNTLKADMAIIVSMTLPKNIKHFDVIEGVWVSDFSSAIGLARALRRGIIEVYSTKQGSIGKNEKMEVLFNYLSGVEFKQKIEAIVESFTSMKTDLDKEKRAFVKMWKTREEQINRVVDNTVGIYGSLEGLMGKALPKIDLLELPDGEESIENLDQANL